ncbi:hypothetical protein AC233_13275 [Burkholderia sp. HB1]|nr:hypothetical protein AC233_13275 [Burkholderia sp. HB1]
MDEVVLVWAAAGLVERLRSTTVATGAAARACCATKRAADLDIEFPLLDAAGSPRARGGSAHFGRALSATIAPLAANDGAAAADINRSR